MAAKKAPQRTAVKGGVIATPSGKSLFVSVPAASTYDATKQEASILLTAEASEAVKAKLQDFIDSADVVAAGLSDAKFVSALFKDDTDQDGNATGLLRVKTKTGMQYPAKIYDHKGDVVVPPVGFSIPNRADIKLSFRPEVMSTSMFTGIVLRLQAIKILNMPQYDDGLAGSEDEGSYSFDAGAPQAPEAPAGGNDGWDS